MATQTLLRVRDLHAGYGRAEVLHGLSISADVGQVITVIGADRQAVQHLGAAIAGMQVANAE